MKKDKYPNLDIRINLKKFTNAFVQDVKGRTATKRCVIIPIDDNHLYSGAKGVYADLIGFGQTKGGNSSCTQIIKRSLTKKEREMFSEEEKREMEILGNVIQQKSSSAADEADGMPVLQAEPDADEELPF